MYIRKKNYEKCEELDVLPISCASLTGVQFHPASAWTIEEKFETAIDSGVKN